MLTMYAMTAIWIHLWAPLYAVINSIMFNTSRDAMNQVTGGTGGTIENMSHLLQMTVSDQGMAGLMVISVPAIALAIVKGGAVAMSGVVNSLMSPAQSAAARVGSEVGMGNVSAGRVQWGGATFDSSVTRRGNFTTEEMGGFKAHYDSGGSLMSVSGGAASIGGEASQARQRVASAGREVASTQQQVAEKLTQLTSALEQSDQFRATRAMQEALSTTGGRNMEAMGGGQTSSAQIGTTTQTNRMGTVAAQDKTDALRMEGGIGTTGTGGATGLSGGPGKSGGALGGGGPAWMRALHLMGMAKGGLMASTQEADNFRQQMENLNSLDGAKRSEAQNFMRNASGFFMRTAGEMKDSSTREAMYNLASSLKDSVSASERLSQSISDAQKAGINVSDTSGFSANARVNSETAAVLAATGGDTNPAAVFAAMAGAQRAPVQEAAHLANAIPQSGSGFDAVAPAPQTPDALRASAAPGVSNAAAMYMGDVQAANAGYGGQVRDEMLEKAGFTPEQRVSAGAAIARAQAGLVAMNGEMQTQMQQARAMLGAQSAAMAIVQQEMESRGQNFNMDQGDLRSRVADYGAQILNASQNDPVSRDVLANNGAMPAGRSANYSSEDLAAIQARSGVTPRPKDEGKNLGRVSDVIAP
ncbi:MAG: conjugal transfer protein TraG N-terminal domain-containing protein [Thiobacillus sp.]